LSFKCLAPGDGGGGGAYIIRLFGVPAQVEFESKIECSLSCFKSLDAGACNVGLIGSACTALPIARRGIQALRHRGHPLPVRAGMLKWSLPDSHLNSVSGRHVSLCLPEILEIKGLFTQGSRRGRTVGDSVGGIFEMDSYDWSNGIRYHIFDTRPDTEFKPSLRVTRNAEGPHMIGRESDSLRFDWLDLLRVSRQF